MNDPAANVLLVGFMGTGKSTVGRRVARALRWRFVDLDGLIASEAGCSIPDIFAREGEEAFRQREHLALQSCFRRNRQIIACGGGIVLREDNRRLMLEQGRVFCLSASLETVRQRVGHDPRRPLANQLEALYAARLPLYRSFPEQIASDGRSAREVAEDIVTRLRAVRESSDGPHPGTV